MSALTLLPWQGPVLAQALQGLSSSAALIHGAAGSGQLNLAFQLARAWLCEGQASSAGGMFEPAPADTLGPQAACGQCPSCHLVDTGHHPDLIVVLPEVMWPRLGWPHIEEMLDKADKSEGKKRKPSQEIKVDAIREVVGFSQSTVSRGVAKVVLIHPAERMNTVSANTLLKTLEEPPGHVRFILSASSLQDVLPTVRSRCQAWHLPMPESAQVLPWLQDRLEGLSTDDAQTLLHAAGGSPEGALDLVAQGWHAAMWRRLPQDLKTGKVGPWGQWPIGLLVDTLQKLAHDMARVAVSAPPRYFPEEALPKGAGLPQVTAWAQELRKASVHAEHPWNAVLKAESLLFQARRALA